MYMETKTTTPAALTCPTCDGRGYVPTSYGSDATWGSFGSYDESEDCGTCDGTGFVICRVCPNLSDDQPAVTVCYDQAQVGLVSNPVCVGCARAACGSIDFIDVAPWLDNPTPARNQAGEGADDDLASAAEVGRGVKNPAAENSDSGQTPSPVRRETGDPSGSRGRAVA